MNKLKTIYVVFKTHFDIGFTGLASEVIDSYQGSMLRSALEICETTATNAEGHRYVWTMSSWPFKKALATSDRVMRKKAEACSAFHDPYGFLWRGRVCPGLKDQWGAGQNFRQETYCR